MEQNAFNIEYIAVNLISLNNGSFVDDEKFVGFIAEVATLNK